MILSIGDEKKNKIFPIKTVNKCNWDKIRLFTLLYVKHEEITYKIIACAMEVHKKLGPGYPE